MCGQYSTLAPENWHFSQIVSLLSSFWAIFERVVNGLGGQKLGGGIMSNHWKINKFYLIEIVQFCFKIYDFWRHPHQMLAYWWISGLMGELIDRAVPYH